MNKMREVMAQRGHALFYDSELAKERPRETSVMTAVSGQRFQTRTCRIGSGYSTTKTKNKKSTQHRVSYRHLTTTLYF